MTPRAFLPLAVLLAVPLHAAPVAFDPALVEPEVMRKTELRAPYLARFEKDGRVLLYVAARHEVTFANSTMDLIRRAFRDEKPDCLVIEGVSNGTESGFLAYARRACGESACPAGEPAFAALLAEEKKIPFAGGEPGDERVLPAMEKLRYSRRDVFNFYFARRVPQYRREGRQGEPLAGLYSDYLKKFPSFQGDGFTFDDFSVWYRERNGKAFELASFDDDEVAPKSAGKFYTQRLSAAVNLVRNRFAVALVAEKMTAHRRVLIVYGGSHFLMERRALERTLGKARIVP